VNQNQKTIRDLIQLFALGFDFDLAVQKRCGKELGEIQAAEDAIQDSELNRTDGQWNPL